MNQNPADIYEKAQLVHKPLQQDDSRIISEILQQGSDLTMISNPKIMAKLSALGVSHEITEGLYPAITEIFAFLIASDSRFTNTLQFGK